MMRLAYSLLILMITSITKDSKSILRDARKFDLLRKKQFHPKSDISIGGEKLTQLREAYKKTSKKTLTDLVENSINEKVLSISPVKNKSTFHTLFFATTKTRRVIIKLNVIGKRSSGFPFVIEEFFQQLLQVKRMPSLAVKVDVSKTSAPFEYEIIEVAEGESLENQNNKKIYTQLGKLFKKIHSLKGNNAGLISIESLALNKLVGLSASWRKFFFINFDVHVRKVIQFGMLSKADGAFVKKMSEKYVTNSKKMSLLHNDPSLRNMYADSKKITALLDWEDAIIGDPLFEVANMHTFLFLPSHFYAFESFCDGYGVALSTLFTNPLYWVYYLRIALFKAVSRNREGYYNNDGFKIDKIRIDTALIELRKYL